MSAEDNNHFAIDDIESLLKTSTKPAIILDNKFFIHKANTHFVSFFNVKNSKIKKKDIFTIGVGEWNFPSFVQLLDNLVTIQSEIYGYEIEFTSTSGKTSTLLINGQPFQSTESDDYWLYLEFNNVTEQRKIDAIIQEEEIKRLESEDRFKIIADTAPVLIWLSGPDKLCHFFNKGWLDFTGRTIEQEMGNGWTEGVHPDDYGSCLQTYSNNFDQRKEFYMEYRLRRYDGQYRWISDRGAPRYDINGEFIGYVGSCIDIHDQKDFAEALETKVKLRTQELEESKAFLNSVLNSAYFGIATYEPIYDSSNNIIDFKIKYTNPEVPENFGLKVQDVIGKTCREVYPGIFENEVFEKMKYVFCHNTFDQYDVKVNINNRDIWLSAIIEKLNDCLIVTSKNTTTEKEAAIDLIKMNTLLKNKNRELEQVILNEFSQSFDLYATGKPFFDFLLKEIFIKTKLDYIIIGEIATNKEAINCLSVCAFGEIDTNFNYPLKDSPCSEVIKGKFHSYPSNAQAHFPNNQFLKDFKAEGYLGYPLLDKTGKCNGLIAILHKEPIKDITYIESLMRIAAKRAEIELEKMRSEILLEQKNQKLQNQNKELTSFAYIASHDLQEPLRKIRMFTSRILETDGNNFTANTLDYFSNINDTVQRMQNLINDLLIYSSIDPENLSKKKTNLDLIFKDLLKDLDHIINDTKSIIVNVQEMPTIQAVPTQIKQLFSNILLNAIKFRKQTGIHEINVSCETITINNEEYYRINVADNGIGFDMAYRDKIFEVFQRLHGKKEYAGTGIGLGICKKIMHNHNGFISATGALGIGAVFSMDFPIKNK
ncbi:MAG TPA: PAS domain S-box protein [Flavobacterium sp.]|jgi:PAS domain S-box-containing protein